MYSITSSVVYMLAVLLSYVFSSENPFNVPKAVFSPFYFGYNTESNSILNLDVTLKNIQTSVIHLIIFRNTYQNYYGSQGPTVTTLANVNVDEKTRESEFIIHETLKYSQTWFEVALYNRTGLCYISQIIEGRNTYNLYKGDYFWDTTQSKRTYYYNNYLKTNYASGVQCFAPNVCKMEVDLSKACEELPRLSNKSHDGSPVLGNKSHSTESPVTCNKTDDESPATVRLDVMIVVVIFVAVISGGLVLLFTKKCRRVKSNTIELPQTHKVGNPFYVNMLFKNQCQKEIEEADSHYEEIN